MIILTYGSLGSGLLSKVLRSAKMRTERQRWDRALEYNPANVIFPLVIRNYSVLMKPSWL